MKITQEDKAIVERLVANINNGANGDKILVTYENGKLKGDKYSINYILSKLPSSTIMENSGYEDFEPIVVEDSGEDWEARYEIDRAADGSFFMTRTIKADNALDNVRTVRLRHSDMRKIRNLDKVTMKDIKAIVDNMEKFGRGFGL